MVKNIYNMTTFLVMKNYDKISNLHPHFSPPPPKKYFPNVIVMGIIFCNFAMEQSRLRANIQTTLRTTAQSHTQTMQQSCDTCAQIRNKAMLQQHNRPILQSYNSTSAQ